MVCVLHWSFLYSLPVNDKIKMLLFQQKHRLRQNDTGTVVFTIYCILSKKKSDLQQLNHYHPTCVQKNLMWMKFIAKSTIIIGKYSLKFSRKVSCWKAATMVVWASWWGKGGKAEKRSVSDGYSSGLMVRLWNQFLYCWAGCEIMKQT